MPKLKYIHRLNQIPHLRSLSASKRRRMEAVEEKFMFRSNEYYQSLIDWNDPADPIRRIIIPHEAELDEWGQLDASNESDYAVAPGLEHKYPDTALLLVNDVCGALCRFCFRKRIFMEGGNGEISRDVSQGLIYIRNHPEISNVLLTGGDPLLLSTRRLREIVAGLREIDHVRIIRIGSKMAAFNPFRILEDAELLDIFRKFSTPERRIYFMAHFNHPRELTDEAGHALRLIQDAGVPVMNQTPIVRGVNDDPEVLGELFDELSYRGVSPYYAFQCRPTRGNFTYAVPIEEAFKVFSTAISRASGLARRIRFVMSHGTGKIEVLGLTDDRILFRYHRAADPSDEGRILEFRRNPDAYWLDDYFERTEEIRTVLGR